MTIDLLIVAIAAASVGIVLGALDRIRYERHRRRNHIRLPEHDYLDAGGHVGQLHALHDDHVRHETGQS
jgi:hypothetical protein